MSGSGYYTAAGASPSPSPSVGLGLASSPLNSSAGTAVGDYWQQQRATPPSPMMVGGSGMGMGMGMGLMQPQQQPQQQSLQQQYSRGASSPSPYGSGFGGGSVDGSPRPTVSGERAACVFLRSIAYGPNQTPTHPPTPTELPPDGGEQRRRVRRVATSRPLPTPPRLPSENHRRLRRLLHRPRLPTRHQQWAPPTARIAPATVPPRAAGEPEPEPQQLLRGGRPVLPADHAGAARPTAAAIAVAAAGGAGLVGPGPVWLPHAPAASEARERGLGPSKAGRAAVAGLAVLDFVFRLE